MSALNNILRCLTWGVLSSGCASLTPTRRLPSAADSLLALTRLNAILVDHTREALQRDVAWRLSLGLRLDRLPSHYADMRHDDARYARAVQRDLETIRYDALPQDDYLTLLALHWDLGNIAESATYAALDFSAVVPGASPLHAIARALALHPVESAADVQRYLFLLDNLALYIPDIRSALGAQAQRGVMLPRQGLDTIAAFVRSFARPPGESPFALAAAQLEQIDSASRVRVVGAMARVIERDVNPQLDSLATYLDGPYRAAATDRFGLAQYPGGREYYRYLLRRETTVDAEPGDLYAHGLREMERLKAAMTELRRKLGFRGSDSAFRAALRGQRRFVVGSPNEFESHIRAALRKAIDSGKARLGLAAQDSIALIAAASQLWDGSRALRLLEPDGLDERWRVEYSRDRVGSIPVYVIPALVHRELFPGRQLLIVASGSNDSLPSIRQYRRIAGFLEGWSEFSGALAGELGLYDDPYNAYGELILELHAAARLVADIGVHFYEWPFGEAVRYLRAHSMTAETAQSDMMRIAIVEPARAAAGTIVSRELAGQRAWVKESLGSRFDAGALQAELLRVGELPLPILSQHLAWYVWQRKSAAADTIVKR